ncbi:MAG: DUF4974 domain-containing protein [Dysgonamonadaceae bacterium]|nr:DUF4974 domain-containing protein [Dysgonamonadaceae bacterium]
MLRENFIIADSIFLYLQGKLPEAERKTLEAWLKQSDAHQELFAALSSSKSFRDKRELYERFARYHDFSAVSRRIRKRKVYRIGRFMAIAASILLPLAILTGIWTFQIRTHEPSNDRTLLGPGRPFAMLKLSDGEVKQLDTQDFNLTDAGNLIVNEQHKLSYISDPETVADTAEEYNEIVIPRGAEYQVTLSDGTQIWLNSESSMRFPVRFTRNERRIQVSGEIFICVAKDSLRPFIVSTPDLGDIRVLGTTFGIRDYKDETLALATLVEGRIAVEGKENTILNLNPSEQLVVDRTSGKELVRTVDVASFVSWKDGVYVFHSQRLEDIMRVIAKWYDVEVSFSNEALRDVVFSGRLKRYEHATALLNAFEKIGGIRFVVHNRIVEVETE